MLWRHSVVGERSLCVEALLKGGVEQQTSEDAWHKYTIKGVRISFAENLRIPG
jgi:hypothetical protein